MSNYKNLSDEELDALIEKEYGEEWKLEDIDTHSELFQEYWDRISQG